MTKGGTEREVNGRVAYCNYNATTHSAHQTSMVFPYNINDDYLDSQLTSPLTREYR